jgi:2-polyprenyl-6-methoxyphenol hydroxylase-like FAD-dependent oxidoreductase
VRLDTAAFSVSVIAGKGTTLAMAGVVVLADALADRPGGKSEDAFAAYETRLRPWAEAAPRLARREVRPFTPASRSQTLSDDGVLRLAARPFPVPLVGRSLNRARRGGRHPASP